MANPHRGEIEAEIAGKTRTLRLPFSEMVEIEQKLGEGLVRTSIRMTTGDCGMRDVHVILFHGLRGGKSPLSEDELARWIEDEGVQAPLAVCRDLLAKALSGGKAEKKDRAAPQ